MMPSGCAVPTSIVLINFIVLVSNIETGLLLVKPWPDFGSTAAPLPPTPSISPTGSSVSRLKIVSRVGRRAPRARVRGRGGGDAAARNVQPASGDVGVDVVPAAFAADPRGLQHFVGSGADGLLSRSDQTGGQGDRARQSGGDS